MNCVLFGARIFKQLSQGQLSKEEAIGEIRNLTSELSDTEMDYLLRRVQDLVSALGMRGETTMDQLDNCITWLKIILANSRDLGIPSTQPIIELTIGYLEELKEEKEEPAP